MKKYGELTLKHTRCSSILTWQCVRNKNFPIARWRSHSIKCYTRAVKKSAQKNHTPAIVNRRARFDYDLGDEIVAGIVLNGLEARAARDAHVQLRGAYITVRNQELWLNNASFSVRLNEQGRPGARSVSTSPRKLLVHKKQLDQLAAHKKEGMTIIPTKLLTSGRHIKVVIALGKGKKRWDKRETIKRRDIDREHKRILKG